MNEPQKLTDFARPDLEREARELQLSLIQRHGHTVENLTLAELMKVARAVIELGYRK